VILLVNRFDHLSLGRLRKVDELPEAIAAKIVVKMRQRISPRDFVGESF